MDSAFNQPTSTTPRRNWQLDQCYREGCKLERELAAVTEQRDMLAEELDALKQSMLDLSHPNMKLLLEERNEARTSSVCTHGTTTASAQGWALKHEAVTEQRDRLAEVLTSIMPIFNFKYLSHEEKQKVRYASEVIAVIKGGNNE
jgi:septal ring factor EnvC (AmiA/AmiB activator)